MVVHFYVDAAVGSLHHVDMDRDADVLEVYASFIFSVEVSRVIECEFIYIHWSKRPKGGRVGAGAQSHPMERLSAPPQLVCWIKPYIYMNTHSPYSLQPWRQRQHVPPNHQQHYPSSHSVKAKEQNQCCFYNCLEKNDVM